MDEQDGEHDHEQDGQDGYRQDGQNGKNNRNEYQNGISRMTEKNTK